MLGSHTVTDCDFYDTNEIKLVLPKNIQHSNGPVYVTKLVAAKESSVIIRKAMF